MGAFGSQPEKSSSEFQPLFHWLVGITMPEMTSPLRARPSV